MKIEEGKYYKANYTVDDIEDNLLTGIVIGKEKIDCNSIRTKAAIAAMQGLLASNNICDIPWKEGMSLAQMVAKVAVGYANALIAELKKGE